MISKQVRFLFSILLLLPVIAFSQNRDEDYYKGYVVSNSGDTIPGKLLKSNQYLRLESISFTANGAIQQFNQDDIRAFYIDELDLLFESHTITKNENSNTKNPVEAELTGLTRTGRHFVLALATTSQYGIYSFLDDGKVNRLYYRSGDKLEELLLYKIYTYPDNIRRIEERKRYVAQLLRFLIDCPDLRENVNSASYSNKAFKNLLFAYAKCRGDKLTYQPEKKRLDVGFGFTLGIGKVITGDPSETAKGGASNNRLASSQFDKGGWFELGLALRVKSKRDDRFVYKGELKIRTQNARTSWSRDVPVTNLVTNASYNFRNTHLSFHFLTNVNLSRWESGAFFFEGGFYLANALSGKIEIINERPQLSGELLVRDDSLDIVIRKLDVGFTAGFGLEINRIAATLRYNTSVADESSRERSMTLRIAAVSLNLAYML